MKTPNYLTNREQEILNLLSCGHSTPEIADILFLSPETVKTHRRNLVIKLNAKNVAHLIRIGFESGVIKTHKSIEKINYHFSSKLEMVA